MKEQVLQNLATTGICVIEEYYDKEFCEQAIKDIEDGLIKYPDKVQKGKKITSEYHECIAIGH